MNKQLFGKLARLAVGGALLFYVMSGLSSVLNYALYPVLSRILPIESFGEIQFLLSVSNQLSFGFVVLNILAIIITASISNSKEASSSVKSLTIVAGVISLAISLFGTVVLLIFSEALKINSSLSIFLLALSFVLNVPFTTLIGQLQGNNKFMASGIVSLVATLGKFIFSLLFVIAGAGVPGVMAGIVCGMILAIIIGALLQQHRHQHKRISFQQHAMKLSTIRQQALAGTVAILSITLLSSIDLVVSRLVLDSTDAGYYAVIATIAKITIAACSPLIWLALPAAAKSQTIAIWKYILVGLVVCAIFTSILFLKPAEITILLMSVNPGAYLSLLIPLTLSMSLYAIAFITLASVVTMNRLRNAYISVSVAAIVFTAPLLIAALLPGGVSISLVITAQMAAGATLLLINLSQLHIFARTIRV